MQNFYLTINGQLHRCVKVHEWCDSRLAMSKSPCCVFLKSVLDSEGIDGTLKVVSDSS